MSTGEASALRERILTEVMIGTTQAEMDAVEAVATVLCECGAAPSLGVARGAGIAIVSALRANGLRVYRNDEMPQLAARAEKAEADAVALKQELDSVRDENESLRSCIDSMQRDDE